MIIICECKSYEFDIPDSELPKKNTIVQCSLCGKEWYQDFKNNKIISDKKQINLSKIKTKFETDYKVIIAPGPKEIDEAKKFDAKIILDNNKALNVSQLTSLIKESSFVVANDTGPAHIAAHVAAKGLTLFGKHTTAHKVSIERENFKSIQVTDLNNLSANKVFERLLDLL